MLRSLSIRRTQTLTPEKTSGANIGIRAHNTIDTTKANLEKACSNTVSYADIDTFAARDASVYLSNGGVNFAKYNLVALFISTLSMCVRNYILYQTCHICM